MIFDELVKVESFEVDSHSAYTLFKLKTEGHILGLYAAAEVSRHLTQNVTKRPSTHNLIVSLLLGFDANILRGVIEKVEESIFYAKLIIRKENKMGIEEIIAIDIRPSDMLLLAHNIPFELFVAKKVLNSAINEEDDL